MPAKNITIDLDQRNGLYEVVRNHLGSIGDFWLAVQREEGFDKAERLGRSLGTTPRSSPSKATPTASAND